MPNEPSVRRRRVGMLLRQYREAAKLTCDQVGEELDISGPKVSRIETSKAPAARRDVRDMLDLYKVTEEQRAEVMTLLRLSSQRGWWDTYGDRLPPEYTSYIGLEDEAESLRCFEAQVIHGLLQTEDYARGALAAVMRDASPEDVDVRVRVRMERQQLLTRAPDPLRVTFVLDEGALRRMVGGPRLMREQLQHLLDVARLPSVRLQMLPFSSGAIAFTHGVMTLIGFADPLAPDVVYLENITGDLYVEEPAEVARYARTFEELAADALGPDQSKRYIEQIKNEQKGGAG